METTGQLTPFLGVSSRDGVGKLRVAPEALLGAAARDLPALPDVDSLRVVWAILGENGELYERSRPCGAAACPRC
jgi:hypothetical protein